MPATKDASHLLALLAARKLIDSKIEESGSPAAGKHSLPRCKVSVHVVGGECTKAEDSTSPKFSVFPMDLGVAYLLGRMDPRARAAAMKLMFSLFEDIENEEPKALTRKAELELLIAEVKSHKKKIGDREVKGSIKVVAVGDVDDDLPAAA